MPEAGDAHLGNLPQEKFSVIYADPPWDNIGLPHADSEGADTGSTNVRAPTITLEDLKQLPVGDIAEDDCLLFLWSSNPHLPQTIELGRAWGFELATVAFVWHKQEPKPGPYTMSECELCWVMERGIIPRPVGAGSVRQLVSTPPGQDDAKPEEIRKRIEAMFPGQKKIELFTRIAAPGWSAWNMA